MSFGGSHLELEVATVAGRKEEFSTDMAMMPTLPVVGS